MGVSLSLSLPPSLFPSPPPIFLSLSCFYNFQIKIIFFKTRKEKECCSEGSLLSESQNLHLPQLLLSGSLALVCLIPAGPSLARADLGALQPCNAAPCLAAAEWLETGAAPVASAQVWGRGVSNAGARTGKPDGHKCRSNAAAW